MFTLAFYKWSELGCGLISTSKDMCVCGGGGTSRSWKLLERSHIVMQLDAIFWCILSMHVMHRGFFTAEAVLKADNRERMIHLITQNQPIQCTEGHLFKSIDHDKCHCKQLAATIKQK